MRYRAGQPPRGCIEAERRCSHGNGGSNRCSSGNGIGHNKTVELCLPEEKLQRLGEVITLWQGTKSCLKKELLSLIGHLQHAIRIVKPGLAFLRRMKASVRRQLPPHYLLYTRVERCARICSIARYFGGIPLLRYSASISPHFFARFRLFSPEYRLNACNLAKRLTRNGEKAKRQY